MLVSYIYIHISTNIYAVEPPKFNSDFSKYSLIRNKFWTQWIQKIGPIYGLFYILNVSIKISSMFCVRKRNVSFAHTKPMFDREKN